MKLLVKDKQVERYQLNKVHYLEKLVKITSNLSKILTKVPKHNSRKTVGRMLEHQIEEQFSQPYL